MLSGSLWDPSEEVKESTTRYVNEVGTVSNISSTRRISDRIGKKRDGLVDLALVYTLMLYLQFYVVRATKTNTCIVTVRSGGQSPQTWRTLPVHHVPSAALHEAILDERRGVGF